MLDVVVFAIHFDLASVGGIQTNVFQVASGQKKTSGICGSVVGEANLRNRKMKIKNATENPKYLNAISRQFMCVGRAHNVVAFNSRISNLKKENL